MALHLAGTLGVIGLAAFISFSMEHVPFIVTVVATLGLFAGVCLLV